MKSAILSLAIAVSLLAVPTFANSTNLSSVSLETLSDDQLDALVAILSGLPRQ